ncbi:MAG TPA: ATP-dependent helicase HrpB [Aliiroseovarius sp.]|nr:ATP-dependent helicase HrpB [Aliiroseovarius sp.]
MTDPLPIDEALPGLLHALQSDGRAVLCAPPGAGKTTRVPLALLDAGLVEGRIIMLEPRRLAARAAAARMAETLGEKVGARVGYRIRGDSKVSKDTRIEVVTEGILTRMVQADPSLEGIGAVIFDEFHERSLNADLGLALTWEARQALRDDLLVLVMSATLDAGPVAALLDSAPIVTSQGRAFAVDTHWLDRPLPGNTRLENAVAAQVLAALSAGKGDVLVFLPGEGEIRRTLSVLAPSLPAGCRALPLYGALGAKEQRAALAPAAKGQRKVVLATAIAETSLTIPGIRIVVDAGLARRPRFDPGNGMSRLVTERVSRAEAEQRRGRAGRVAPGLCFRLWTRGEEGGLTAFAPAEIEVADLTGLALDLALWGAGDGGDLAFLTPPNPGVLAEARKLLTLLGALDTGGRITAHGKAMARLPLHPRLAHVLVTGGKQAADFAALVSNRDPLTRAAGADLTLRLRALQRPGPDANRAALAQIRDDARRLSRLAPPGAGDHSPAELAAMAWPDRIGLRRKGDAARYVLSGGTGAVLADDDALAGARLIVVCDSDGKRRDARIRSAVQISEAELRAVHGPAIHWQNTCFWDAKAGRVQARRQETFGALVLADQVWKDVPDGALATAMLDGVRALGLRLSDAAKRFRTRVDLLRRSGHDLPDLSDNALMADLETWLLPHLTHVTTSSQWKRFDLLPALRACLSWEQTQRLNHLAPPHFTTPLGNRVPVDYSHDIPEIAVRLQEMFGVTKHPTVAGHPLRITLLSPARRPVQTTTDLPAFWTSSYADVRKDMRGQYPKHPWPQDPTQAAPTLRAKPRKS